MLCCIGVLFFHGLCEAEKVISVTGNPAVHQLVVFEHRVGGIKKGTPPPNHSGWSVTNITLNDVSYPSIVCMRKKGLKRSPNIRTVRHTCNKLSKKSWWKHSQRLSELVHYLQGTLWLWLSNYQMIRWQWLYSVTSVSAFGRSVRRRCPRIFKRQWSEDVSRFRAQAYGVPRSNFRPTRAHSAGKHSS